MYVRLVQRVGCIMTSFLAGYSLCVKLGLLQGETNKRLAVSGSRPFRVAATIFACCSVCGTGVHTLISDSYNCQLDAYADQYAATVSKEFSLAGYNYYNKQLNANKVLRDILPDGEKKFTIFGNERTGVIRMKTISLVSRRDFMKRTYDNQLAAGDSVSTEPQRQKDSRDFFAIKSS